MLNAIECVRSAPHGHPHQGQWCASAKCQRVRMQRLRQYVPGIIVVAGSARKHHQMYRPLSRFSLLQQRTNLRPPPHRKHNFCAAVDDASPRGAAAAGNAQNRARLQLHGPTRAAARSGHMLYRLIAPRLMAQSKTRAVRQQQERHYNTCTKSRVHGSAAERRH
jgi:hypothetical protein